ncbi:hypothetical protein QJQ45_010371 [Haematococcus lacustris]|nr:hypothetical protein QJQ45_010371 [Haematococcus lacustris]
MLAQQHAKTLGATEVCHGQSARGERTHADVKRRITTEAAAQAIASRFQKKKAVSSAETVPFNAEVRRTLEAATLVGAVPVHCECKRAGVNYISPEHILLAMLQMHDSSGRRVLESLRVDCEALKMEANKRLKGDQDLEQPRKQSGKGGAKEGPKVLEEYCKDLCAAARAGQVDPMVGREREVTRVIQVLARRTKNNPVLLGEPGVGKEWQSFSAVAAAAGAIATAAASIPLLLLVVLLLLVLVLCGEQTAIAEGLALAIVQQRNPDGTPLPPFLHDKRILQLDMALLIAGAKERGELEQRVTRLMQEVKDAGNVVLMIDEIHMLVGAGALNRGGRGGGGGSGMDISNILKPALARGEIQVLGATTLAEHRKHFERDAALERRFQPVYCLRERYERHHRVVYSVEALEAAVRLSHKYIADRFLPDKAIDLLDEAGSRVRIQAYNVRKELSLRENPRLREYMQVLDTKDEALKDALFEEAVILRRRETDYRQGQGGQQGGSRGVTATGPADQGSSLPLVDCPDIEAVVAAWTGIPTESMSADEKGRLVQLGCVLKERLIGQDQAVDAVAAALMRARCGLKDPNRPIASLLLVGPTGVGKTELVKVLTEQYFGRRDALIRLDMSEYMERHTVSRMIGAPPGYVGFGEGGKLTEAVRRKPCSIVLFDEVEKAHPDVFNILLQILEDGRLTDSQGRHVSFKNTLIIMTSNIGSRLIASSGQASGLAAFSRGARGAGGEATQADHARLKRLVLQEVKEHFKPELLNRFDEQVVFQKLSKANVRTIAGLMLEETQGRVAGLGYGLELSPALMDFIIQEGHSDEYGARPLRQMIVKYVDDPLSDALLHMQLPLGSVLQLELDPLTRTVSVSSREDEVTVAGHASGYNGSITITRQGWSGAASGGPGGGAPADPVYASGWSGAREDSAGW